MIRSPILKVLSTLTSHDVKVLLMGGQACIHYGAAEFSRDTDLAFHAHGDNFTLLTEALRELHAARIAMPPFERKHLLRGHAVHFRCYHPDAFRMRVDIMSVMRGADSFPELWNRRNTITIAPGLTIDVMALRDLVQVKKTQRDKDWPMIRRLIEADYVGTEHPTEERIRWWLLESRTPEMLLLLSRRHAELVSGLLSERPLLEYANAGDKSTLTVALDEEQHRERETDRAYWKPLIDELESLRHAGYPVEEFV